MGPGKFENWLKQKGKYANDELPKREIIWVTATAESFLSLPDSELLKILDDFGLKGPAKRITKFVTALKSLIPFSDIDPTPRSLHGYSETFLLEFLRDLLAHYYSKTLNIQNKLALYKFPSVIKMNQCIKHIRLRRFLHEKMRNQNITSYDLDAAFRLARTTYIMRQCAGIIAEINRENEGVQEKKVTYKLYANRLVEEKEENLRLVEEKEKNLYVIRAEHPESDIDSTEKQISSDVQAKTKAMHRLRNEAGRKEEIEPTYPRVLYLDSADRNDNRKLTTFDN
jgi:hypothetical protein